MTSNQRKEDSIFRESLRQLEQSQNHSQKKQTRRKSQPKFIVERRMYGSSEWQIHSTHFSLKKAQDLLVSTRTHEYRLKDSDERQSIDNQTL